MASNAQKKAAANAALLKELEEKYNSLDETVAEEEKVDLKSKIDSLKEEIEKAEAAKLAKAEAAKLAKAEGNILVKFIKSPTSAPFFLAHSVGEEVEFNIKQAAELIESEFAEEVKK